MKSFWLLFLSVSAFSCTHVVFDTPQPQDGAPLSQFPAHYLGTYLPDDGEGDSLLIQSRTVTFIDYSDHEISKQALDTTPSITLRNGLLYDGNKEHTMGIPYTVEDTLIKYVTKDVFEIGLSDTLVIKEIKNYLVVNSYFVNNETGYWDVTLARKTQSGDIVVSYVGSLRTAEDTEGKYDGNLEDFARIVPYEKIGERTYLFKPDRAQFVKMIRKGMFSDEETYRRLR